MVTILNATNTLVHTKVIFVKWSPKINTVNGGKKQTNTAKIKEENNLFFIPREIQVLFETFLICKILEKAYSIKFAIYLKIKTKSIKDKRPINNFVLFGNIVQ
ncbi:MAG: hypothetical protein J6S61_05380 [Elusimicrobiaceae bacterium]|nr:hypothetical protein [Elusimicrobiaceae bacterium]